MTCRQARSDDLDAVADLHRAIFPAYESSRLGRGFCRRLLGAFHGRPDAVVLVAEDDGGAIVGYLVGSSPAAQREVNRSLVGAAALAFVTHLPTVGPAGAARALRRLRGLVRSRRPGDEIGSDGGAGPGAPGPTEPDVRVVLVGVAPAGRGQGRADALLAGFAAWARDQGAATADLVVEPGNRAAHAAYERNGWTVAEVDGSGAPTRFGLVIGPPAG